MKNSQMGRQELVSAIESGRYNTGRRGDKMAIGIFAVVFAFIFLMLLFFGVIAGGGIGAIVSVMICVMMFLPFTIILVIASLARGADLSKLTPLSRWLILYGEIIEADLDAIEQKGNLYTFRCNGEYAGSKYQFVSPSINVQPLPFEEKKIRVFVNPQNPNQYLINIYEHLPIAGDNVLHDRSELKVDTSKKNANDSTTVALVVLICIFAVPFGLFGMLAGCGGIVSGKIAFGLFALTVLPCVSILAIVGMLKFAKRNKNMLEQGYYVPATALRFWVTHSKNSTTYHLSARYVEPSTKIVHDFYTTGPSSMKTLVGAKVNVFINPENTREYYMDIKGAMQRLGFTVSKDSK